MPENLKTHALIKTGAVSRRKAGGPAPKPARQSRLLFEQLEPRLVLGANPLLVARSPADSNDYCSRAALLAAARPPAPPATATLTVPAAAGNFAITEINYNPYAPTPEEIAAGWDDADDPERFFEFIELKNIGTQRIDLTGVEFESGISFDFTAADVVELDPGEFIVLANEPDAFEFRYGQVDCLAGEYSGNLSNGGERITLKDAANNVIHDFEYDDGGDWPGRADGDGSSLEVLDTAGDYGDPANWRSSIDYGGSPGADGTDPPAVPPVIVNEVLTHSDYPWSDTIEFYNTTAADIDLGGWWLSDRSDPCRKFQIPAGTIIPSGGYTVLHEGHYIWDGAQWLLEVDPATEFGQTDGQGFGLSSGHGDDVWLISADASGKPLLFVEHVDFGPTQNAVSLGRWPNGDASARLFPMSEPTFGAANSGPKEPDLVISEVMYNPPDPPPGYTITRNQLEFIEVFNPGCDLDLWRSYYLFDEGINDWRWFHYGWMVEDFEFPVDPQTGLGTSMGPGETLILVGFDPADSDLAQQFRDVYGLDPSTALFGSYGTLNNAGEAVRVCWPDEPPLGETDAPYILDDEVAYLPTWYPSTDGGGQSLIRAAVDAYGNFAASWQPADPSPGQAALEAPEPAAAGNLAITEVNYHPYEPTAAEVAQGWIDKGDFEFIELKNIGDKAICLRGVKLIEDELGGGVGFDFSDGEVLWLEPGQLVVVAKEPQALEFRYGPVNHIAGEFSGNLSDGGEQLVLQDATGGVIQVFTYGDSDAPGWPRRADGLGSSLEVLDTAGDYDDPANWRSSTDYGGSPGRSGSEPILSLAVTEINYNPYQPTAAEVAAGFSDNDLFEFIELQNASDQVIDLTGTRFVEVAAPPQGIVFDFTGAAVTELAPGEFVVVVRDAAAFSFRYPSVGNVAGSYSGDLDNGGEQITLLSPEGLIIQGFAYDDEGDWPRRPDGGGSTLELIDTAGDHGDPANWRSSSEYGGSPGGPGLGPFLRITEVNYNPYDPTAAEVTAGFTNNDFFEFIELQNLSDQDIALGGVQLGGAISFSFPSGTLGPSEFVVVVSNTSAFQYRYGSGHNVAGQYSNRLPNDGDRILLLGPGGVVFHDFQYDDEFDWPGRADGKGSSLEIIDTDSDYNDPASWRSSTEHGGSPGEPGSEPILSVVVNELLANSDPPLVDTIELHNPGGSEVDIGGWWLSDSNVECKKYHVPAGTTIPAGGYLVFTETVLGFQLSSTGGEFVCVTAEDGDKLLFVDLVEVGPTETDVSLGRWPNGSGRLFPMAERTFGAENTGPKVPEVIISELQYHPADVPPPPPVYTITEDQLEFVELYNPTGAQVNLLNWEITGIRNASDTGNYRFTTNTYLPAGGTLVLVSFNPGTTAIADQFRAIYGIAPSVTLKGPYSGSLSNAGEVVQLIDATGYVEDEVAYDDNLPWPTEADGGGLSLTRRMTSGYGNLAASWAAATPTPGSVDWQPVYWDQAGEGNWAKLDAATGLSRWQSLDGTPMTGYPSDRFTDAVVRTDTVTVSGQRWVRDLTVQSGTILLGDTATLHVAGNLVLAASAKYASEVSQAHNGLIQVATAATLGGSFEVRLAGGYTVADVQALGPSGTVVDTRTVLQGPVAAGTHFTSVPQYLGLDMFATGEIGSGNLNVGAEFLRALSGDADGDRHVDFSDFTRLFNNYTGQFPPPGTEPKSWPQADFDFDTLVTFSDFVQLFNHYTGSIVPYWPAKDGAAASKASAAPQLAPSFSTSPGAAKTDDCQASAHDAVFAQPVGQAPNTAGVPSAKLTWLYQFDQIGKAQRPTQDGTCLHPASAPAKPTRRVDYNTFIA